MLRMMLKNAVVPNHCMMGMGLRTMAANPPEVVRPLVIIAFPI